MKHYRSDFLHYCLAWVAAILICVIATSCDRANAAVDPVVESQCGFLDTFVSSVQHLAHAAEKTQQPARVFAVELNRQVYAIDRMPPGVYPFDTPTIYRIALQTYQATVDGISDDDQRRAIFMVCVRYVGLKS